MSDRQGPKLTIVASCSGCAYEHGEHYSIEDGNDVDSGFNVYCTHTEAPGRRTAHGVRIGDTDWNTPAWCPLFSAARVELLKAAGALAAVEVGRVSAKVAQGFDGDCG
jgi:hypothetical protein